MRHYKRLTQKGLTSQEVMEKAAKLVVDNEGNNDFSIRKIAKEFGINYSTLSRFIKRKKHNTEETTYCGYARPNQVFTDDQELILIDYIQRFGEIMFGITKIEVRKLAYLCAKTLIITMPAAWEAKKTAGVDWFSGFLKRNAHLSIRPPLKTNLASFNETNIAEFLKKLRDVLARHPIRPGRIWNIAETGLTTVLTPHKITAHNCAKQMASVEQGELVTMAAAVCALGTFIPPMLIIPQKYFKDNFIRDGPVNCIGAVTSSGCMVEESFIKFLKYFIAQTKATKEDPILLFLDNHASHLSVEGLDLCEENGVMLLYIPPHCSHWLQPFEVSVYEPFKTMYNKGIDTWMKTNPGKALTISDLPCIIKEAFNGSFTPSNIISGFSETGIYPLNDEKFQECDFLASFVPDRFSPDLNSSPDKLSKNDVEAISGFSAEKSLPTEETDSFLKAELRVESNKEGKRRNYADLTENLEKVAIEKEREGDKAGTSKKIKIEFSDSSEDEKHEEVEEDEEAYYLKCGYTYKREEFVQCIKCKLYWSIPYHDPCYVCINCCNNENKEV